MYIILRKWITAEYTLEAVITVDHIISREWSKEYEIRIF